MIILTKPNDPEFVETYTTLKQLCRLNKWAKYHYLRDRRLFQFPFEYKGYRFTKHKVR